GWSVGASPEQGRMDLLSVVTHEVGHALGFDHEAAGVMEAALAPGVRLVPEALAGTGTSVGTAASTSAAPAVSRAADPAVAAPHAPPPTSSHTAIIDAAFTSGTPAFVTPPVTATEIVAPAPFQDSSGSQRNLATALVNLGQQSPPPLAATTAIPATVPADPA